MNYIDYVKTPILLIFFSFTLFSDNCIAQSLSYTDSIPASAKLSPDEKLRVESEWLRASIVSQDSIFNLMATRADLELKNQCNNRYIRLIISSLLGTLKDTALHVIANNLSVCPYIHQGKMIHVVHHINSFPVVEAIERAPPFQINMFKNYLLRPDFLNKNLSNDEIGILHYLLVQHDPAFARYLFPESYTGQALKNAQLILEWKSK